MYSIGASAFNSRGPSLYGGAMYGGLAPGSGSNNWYDLLKTQKYLSLKRKFAGLTPDELAKRKRINAIIMRGTLEKNPGLKAARLVAAQPGEFNYHPPSTPQFFEPSYVKEYMDRKASTWDQLRDPSLNDGAEIGRILKLYKNAAKTQFDSGAGRRNRMPNDPIVKWRTMPPVPSRTVLNMPMPTYETMTSGAEWERAADIRRVARRKALERLVRRMHPGLSDQQVQNEAARMDDVNQAAQAAANPPPQPAGPNYITVSSGAIVDRSRPGTYVDSVAFTTANGLNYNASWDMDRMQYQAADGSYATGDTVLNLMTAPGAVITGVTHERAPGS